MPTKTHALLLLAVAALVALALACGGDDDEDVDGFAFSTTAPPATTAAGGDPTAAPSTSDCPEPTGEAPEADVTKQYSAPEDQGIDPSKEYLATVKTERGDFVIKLLPELAPQHVNSFVFLAREGYYDGVTFHRVIPGFVAQAGDPTGSGSGGPGYTIAAEFTTEAKFERGTVGAARATSPDSAGSQFYINYTATPNLDGQYTIFGEVVEGMDVVDCLTPRDPSSNPGAPPGDAIISVEISES